MLTKRKLSIKGVSEEDLPSVLKKLLKKASVSKVEQGDVASKANKNVPLVSLDDSDQDSTKSGSSDESSSGNSSDDDRSSTSGSEKDSASDSDSDSDSDSSSDSDSESSEDEGELERRAEEKRAQKLKEIASSQAAIDAWMEKANDTPSPSKRKASVSGDKESSGSKAFKRVDNDVWSKEIIDGLEDNTYEKVFGEGGYGAKASAKLLQVQGKRFQHEKTKAKRSSHYKGGTIDASAVSKSFKYADSD